MVLIEALITEEQPQLLTNKLHLGGGNDNVNEANTVVFENSGVRLAKLPDTSRSLNERLYDIGNGYAVDVMVTEGLRTDPNRIWSASLAKVSNGRIEFMSDQENINSYKIGRAHV